MLLGGYYQCYTFSNPVMATGSSKSIGITYEVVDEPGHSNWASDFQVAFLNSNQSFGYFI
jgi:hypothetical protein